MSTAIGRHRGLRASPEGVCATRRRESRVISPARPSALFRQVRQTRCGMNLFALFFMNNDFRCCVSVCWLEIDICLLHQGVGIGEAW